MSFLNSGLFNISSNVITKLAPLYVQYYVTARCNLRCEQCNVIYANADRRELETDEALKVVENLGKLGTSVLLLTGGEPFVRKDLPLLAKSAIQNGIHPRIQTNGLAKKMRLEECAEYGVKDISISLDSLSPSLQDSLNGGFDQSWYTAMETISNVSEIFGPNTFAALGCVFSPYNFRQVPNLIRFATEIGWWVSLVPAHYTLKDSPRSFSTFNTSMKFSPKVIDDALTTLDQVLSLKHNGYNVYDSDQFILDIANFIQGKEITWRSKNGDVCDAGSLYFAVLPDGGLAPCCDWRLKSNEPVWQDDFVQKFRNNFFSKEITAIAKACSGCLYGSYPEISISARFAKAAVERFFLFSKEHEPRIRTISTAKLISLSEKFRG